MFNKILKDKYLRAVFGIVFFIFLLAVILCFVKFLTRTESVIVHFDIYKGIDVVGNKAEVFGILAVALVMLVINLFLANFTYDRERFLSYILSFGSLILSILFLIAVAVISSVN